MWGISSLAEYLRNLKKVAVLFGVMSATFILFYDKFNDTSNRVGALVSNELGSIWHDM
jgi:hypothetical protein